MRSKAPRVIDAEFEIVSGVRQRRASVWRRLGAWLLRVALTTAVAGGYAAAIGWIGFVVLRLDGRGVGVLSVAVTVVAVAGSALLRGLAG